MKKKLFILINLILCIFLLSYNSSKGVEGATVNHKALVNEYYFNGCYTKKSNIYLTYDSKNELKKYFHGDVALDRTTYYKDSFLLMGDIDGGFDDINSGYRNSGKDMKHFTYEDGMIVDDYTVTNTDIHSFYVTLDKMVKSSYFDSTWSNGVHNVETDEDPYLADFLAFTAPCLTDLVFNSFYITRIGMKLTITEGNNPTYGDYLSLRIYVGAIDEGKTGSDFVLSEARIYKGNFAFDETVVIDKLQALRETADGIGSNYVVETKVYFNDLAISRVNTIYETNFYCNQTSLFNENYLYRYSDDFVINDAYYKLDDNLYNVSLNGETLEDKLNSNISIEEATISDFTYFSLEEFNSIYIDTYGPTTVKYTSSYSKEYLGWQKLGEGKYYCDRTEVIEDMLSLCAPGFSNEGTYMTFRYVVVEINPQAEYAMRIRLYASPTQIGKLIASHKALDRPENYLLFAEAYIYDVDNVSIPALDELYS